MKMFLSSTLKQWKNIEKCKKLKPEYQLLNKYINMIRYSMFSSKDKGRLKRKVNVGLDDEAMKTQLFQSFRFNNNITDMVELR